MEVRLPTVFQVAAVLGRFGLGRAGAVVGLALARETALLFQTVVVFARFEIGRAAGAAATGVELARDVVDWPALLPQALVVVGRVVEPAPGRTTAPALAPLLTVVVGFARFKLGREAAVVTEFAPDRDEAAWVVPSPQTLVGVGRADELVLGREATFSVLSLLPMAAGFPRFKAGRSGTPAVDSVPVREEGLWPPPLLPAVIGLASSGLGRAVVLPPLESPRETGCCRLLALLASVGFSWLVGLL